MKAFVITKDESNMIKGIAIILMMIHHFGVACNQFLLR